MDTKRDEQGPGPGATVRGTSRLWAAAAAVAALGTWVMFDARPGVNWLLWTGAAAAGLVALLHPQRTDTKLLLLVGAAATLIAGAATVTASEVLHVVICAAVVLLLAVQMLLAVDPSPRRITARFTLTAPVLALWTAVKQALHRTAEATGQIRSTRARAWVRGLALTLPVLILFALLLAEADPSFAWWRDSVESLFAHWAFLPRLVFFTGLLGLVVGAYGYGLTESTNAPPLKERATVRWLGSTERVMLLAAVTALLWFFLALQLGYLFGTLPRASHSGMTFAEYARRGFSELTIVASASAVLILLSEQYGQRERHERLARILAFALVGAVLLVLGSAFHRVLLYEAAYGFTTARLYAQAYMTVVAAALVLLALEVAGALDTGRLFRRTAAVATILFVALLYWNHEAWIARRNIDRLVSTGRLDVAFLSGELSLDALPTILNKLPSLPEPVRSDLRAALQKRWARHPEMAAGPWYEWNVSRARARAAYQAMATVAP